MMSSVREIRVERCPERSGALAVAPQLGDGPLFTPHRLRSHAGALPPERGDQPRE